MKKTILILIGSFLTCTSALVAREKQALLSLGAGGFDMLRVDRRMLQYQAEYQWKASFLGVQPFIGVMFTDKTSVYTCLGGLYDIYLGSRVVLTPSFAPGIYFQNHGKNLGFPLEFRSAIALSFVLKGCHRLGAQFYHISNASLGSKNPGEESLVVFYSLALN